MKTLTGTIVIAAALIAAPREALSAGACTALVSGGILVIECDDEDNVLAIAESSPGVFEVEGDDGTLINGAESAELSGAITGIHLNLRGGEDVAEVSEIDISGTLKFLGGNGPNEFALLESAVGGVVISNKDGGSESSLEESYVDGDVTVDNKDGFDEVKLENTEVAGNVSIDNHDGDLVTGEGSETAIESGALVWGDVTIINRFGLDEFKVEEASVLGTVWIDNGEGDLLSGAGSEIEVEVCGFIAGDLVVLNKTGFDELALQEDSLVAGSVQIANGAGGSLLSIENSAIGGGLSVNNKAGFDAIDFDEAEIGGDLNVAQGPGGSDFLTRSTSGSGAVEIGGSLSITTSNGNDRITLNVLQASGGATILAGSGHDAVEVADSSFGQPFSADGQSGFDSFRGARNSFTGGPALTRFEAAGPAGLLPSELNEFATGFDGSGVPLLIPAIDPAGVTWHAPSGHLFITDSEIDEVPEAWAIVGANVFEVSAAGDTLHATYDLTASGNEEPSGITYNELDGFFYVTNDENQTVTRYSFSTGSGFAVDDVVNTEDTAGLDDPEGITSDPDTGLIYVVDGHAQAVSVYEYAGGFVLVGVLELGGLNNAADVPRDPEGIAFDPCTGNLLLVSDIDEKIYEFTAGGLFVERYDLGDLAPGVIAPQGLAVGPRSGDPLASAIYVADGGVDNNQDPDERDGQIYEVEVGGCPD